MSRKGKQQKSGSNLFGFILIIAGLFFLASVGAKSISAHHSSGHTSAIAVSAPGNCSGVGSVPASLINGSAHALGISCKVVLAQITKESGGVPTAVSPEHAYGVAQFLAGTWSGEGCSGSPFNVNDSMNCYVTFMGNLIHHYGAGDLRDVLAAYNAGENNLPAGYGYADFILAAAGQ